MQTQMQRQYESTMQNKEYCVKSRVKYIYAKEYTLGSARERELEHVHEMEN